MNKSIASLLIISVFMPTLVHAGFLDNLRDAAGLVKGFGSVLDNRGGVKNTEVPVSDKGVRDVQERIRKKEIGVKRIPLPGIGGINLPFPVPGSSDDSFAWNLANMAIHKISKEVVNWIRYGGKERGRKGTSGSLFVTNWEDFLKDVANEASGIFIEEFELTELCKPFKPRLQILLGSGRAPYYQRARCTIEDVANNVERFYRDFKQGGWARWFQITMIPQNNFYGAYYMSLEEKLIRESSALEAQNSMAIASGGFLGKEECVEYAKRKSEGGTYPNDSVGPLPCKKWRTVTPGTLIQDQLNEVFKSDKQRLEVADEIDEIVVAAFQRLFSELRKSQQGVLKGKGTPATPTKPATIDPLEQFIKDTEREVSSAIDQVSKNLELPQAIILAEQTAGVKRDSIDKSNAFIFVLEFDGFSLCPAANDAQRIGIAKNNIIQLNKDIQNIAAVTTQLKIGIEQLDGTKNIDEVYELYSDLKAAVDVVIYLYDFAVAENSQIAAELTSTQQELEACINTTTETRE